jgi:CrcB protein
MLFHQAFARWSQIIQAARQLLKQNSATLQPLCGCQSRPNPINNDSGNGVCRPERENRLTVSVLMTPTSGLMHWREFFMVTYLLVALGGALGSVARFWFSGFIAQRVGETFPWGTLIVNITGSFIIGFFASVTGPDGRWLAPSNARLFFMTGICGGYTTFSSFSLQTLNLARGGDWFRAGANCVGSLVLCLVAVWLGHLLAMTLNSTKGT